MRIRNPAWEGRPLPRWRKHCHGIDWQLLREGYGWNGPRLVFGWNGPPLVFGWNGPRLRYCWNGVQLGWNGRRRPGYGWNGPPRHMFCCNGPRVELGPFPVYVQMCTNIRGGPSLTCGCENARLYCQVNVAWMLSAKKDQEFVNEHRYRLSTKSLSTSLILSTLYFKTAKQLVHITTASANLKSFTLKFRWFIAKNCEDQANNFSCKEMGKIRIFWITDVSLDDDWNELPHHLGADPAFHFMCIRIRILPVK